ncbi:hypothetical protein Taro_045267 [Colocasia esculenta]|uniref:Protein kinase domain-containing protein n=1 Tax=Colocasia esculenta TaxID=4460 RepID=A0A843WQT1_COLES|nr:hypothetical protein [Colocasia esculenta]
MQIIILVLLLCLGHTESKSDFDALVEFRNGIKEDPSGHLATSWTTTNSPQSGGCPSNWFGVQCDVGRVTSITLSSMGLVGEINFSALAELEKLRNLSVSHNRLTGVLPRELASMKSLEQLDLSDNLFSGSIPTELTNLGSLVYLNLSSNSFSGIFPLGFRKLGRLTHLDLRANDMSGDVEGCLAELQNLVHVDLSQNAFSGSLGSVSDKSTLVKSIQYLSVSHNKLSGQLFPQGVPLFDSLEVFDASHNQLEGHIPLFNFLVSLRVLRLANNKFSGSPPEALLQESSMVLGDLDLSSNKLEGQIGSITSTSLKSVNISSNKLAGSLPAKVGNCAIIDLSNNMISGNLSSIRNWGNYVEVIDLSSNSLTGTLPSETSLFLRLTSFKVSDNMLQGELPFLLGTYPELKVIDLSFNKLYGSLPLRLFTSSRLSELNLSGNSFTGSIPFPNTQAATPMTSNAHSYAILNYSLVSLDLSNNLLSGSLSAGISAFKSLKLFNIGRNNISGTIPPQINILRSLMFLDLSCNHLEGSIPNNLSEELVGFNISYNNLSGAVPDSLLRFPDSSFHPGNALLVFPDQQSTNVPDLGAKQRHLKPLIRNILIGALVGAISVIILLSLLIYYRASLAKGSRKDADKRSPLMNIFGHQRPADPPPLSLSQNHLLSLGSDHMSPEHGDITLADRGPVKSGRLESPKGEPLAHVISSPQKTERQSPFSLFSSSPHSRGQGSSEQPSAFKVCSPDRLAGDLHLFDNSFVFTAEELSRAPAEIIGRSCHGTTYKATLDNGHVVTVKWLREGITKSKKEFAREAKKLGNIRHPSIISLRGYYWGPREHERLIISDYINEECLTAHLCGMNLLFDLHGDLKSLDASSSNDAWKDTTVEFSK